MPGGQELTRRAEIIGRSTNNQAEYRELILGLTACAAYTRSRVRCVSDSTLVVGQMSGDQKVRASDLKPLYSLAKECSSRFAEVTFRHRPRSEPHISQVDRLVNAALDEYTLPDSEG
jgi:ribonuclease HI